MLVSLKIKDVIKKEIKAQDMLLKSLESQEKNYGSDFSKEKEEIKKSIDYYEKFLRVEEKE